MQCYTQVFNTHVWEKTYMQVKTSSCYVVDQLHACGYLLTQVWLSEPPLVPSEAS